MITFASGIDKFHIAYLLNELMTRHKKNHEKRKKLGEIFDEDKEEVELALFLVDVNEKLGYFEA